MIQNRQRSVSDDKQAGTIVAVVVCLEHCQVRFITCRALLGDANVRSELIAWLLSNSPVAHFLDKWGIRLEGAKKQTFLQSIMDDVCSVYGSLSSDLLKSALELEESLKSRKLQRHTSRSNADSNSLSDTEKMRLQLLLDLQEMQRSVVLLSP